jgi:hypothetical protein
MYRLSTSKSNCRRHLRSIHGPDYDAAVRKNKWPFPLSTEIPNAKIPIGEQGGQVLPEFTVETFIEYLVRFIVADDQVSSHFLFLTHVLTFS